MTALLASEMPNASHLVKDDQSPVASSFRSPAMAFADRAVVMNGGRIEQIGRPRAKREASPNQSVALVVPRGGVKQCCRVNNLSCPTLRSRPIVFQGVFLTLSHRFSRLPLIKETGTEPTP